MNDDQIMTAVHDSFAGVRLDVPLEQTVRRGRVLRGRSRAYRAAAVAGVTAIAGVTAVAVTGLGRTHQPQPGLAYTEGSPYPAPFGRQRSPAPRALAARWTPGR